ncbi:hypothetical protein [Arcanobacterium canis]
MSKEKTPRFGRVKFGSGERHSALSISIPAGIILAALISILPPLFRTDDLARWIAFLVFFIATTPVCVAIVWVCVVDLKTIPGRLAKPEESVESQWASKAAENTFYVILGGLGLVTAGFSIFGAGSVTEILFWVLLGITCIYGLFYAWAKYGK